MLRIHYLGAALIAATLTACGGGGGGGGAAATPPVVITQANASSALSNAKQASGLGDLALLKNGAAGSLLTVITQSGGLTGAAGNTPASAACAISGTRTISWVKTKSTTGLNAGDSVTVVNSNCKDTATGVAVTGTVKLSALTTTSANVYNATSYSLPFAITMTTLKEVFSNTLTTNSNGTINYNTYTVTPSTVTLASSAATFSQSVVSTGNPTLTNDYSGLTSAQTYNVSSSVLVSYSTFDVTSTLAGHTPVRMHVVESNTLNLNTSVTSAANYVITNYMGGKVSGAMPSGSSTMSVSVDYGNDGTVDLTYTTPFSGL
jgi:hypothetical protein